MCECRDIEKSNRERERVKIKQVDEIAAGFLRPKKKE